MGQRIWKYRLEVMGGPQQLKMPEDTHVVHVGVQDGAIMLWAIVNPDLPPTPRIFEVIGTGHLMEYDYLGTVHMPPYVWHVTEQP